MIDIGIHLSSPATILARYALLEHLHRRVLSLDQVLGSLRSESKASESRGSQLSKIPPHIATSDTRSTCRSIWDLKAGICHQMGSGVWGVTGIVHWRDTRGVKSTVYPFCEMFRFQVFFFFLSHDSKFCWHLTFLGQLSSIRWICGWSSFGFVTRGFVGAGMWKGCYMSEKF